MKKNDLLFEGDLRLDYPDLVLREEKDENAVRGKVGKIIDSVYVNEAKKTTTVKFSDGSVQTVTCHADDTFDPIVGVAVAVSSFVFGSKKNFHEVVARKLKKSSKKNK